ncbi:MAG: bifunctional methylenetetrahydrofolate dehydrogenase/methenyltetrahydrofolate cyclohydrolase FolD [Eubacteriales bacterium]|nr:bifunctional methylenetetrahydrofolate dehydrogenase/methenyltetrahydrofolate cyclohydrolase FolD [Eubacteriales bacterium]
MSNKIIDGKEISQSILNNVTDSVNSLKKRGINPCLSVILVGDDPASQVYVRNKEKACEKVGIISKSFRLPATISQEELENIINDLNNDKNVNGILLQLPLPKHLNEEKALLKIEAAKDVDGFHVINTGKLLRGLDCIMPCTPKGCIEMLDYIGYDCDGKNAVVLGRSNLVGKPLAIMLLQKNATVTVCHSHTQDLKEITKRADILVAAIGKPKFVTEDMVKEGAVVIDVGINRVDGKLCGDVDFDKCYEKVSYITPVPGGVGKMTIAMLMQNTLKATKIQIGEI